MQTVKQRPAKVGREPVIAICICLALFTGCQPGTPDDRYHNYLTRLGRTLTVDVPVIDSTTLPVAPRVGRLQIDTPSSSLDTLDFLTLRGCAVQVTLGKRNSSLGRMAKPSQRLLLELEYLRLAPECINYQRDNDRQALANTLQQAWELKRQQLPALIFNATLGSAEYRSFWRAAKIPSTYPTATNSQVISALRAINDHTRHWLAGEYEANNRDFEILLSDIAAGDGSALLRSLTRQHEWLAAADSMLDEHRERGPLCTPNIRPAAADILPNVIRKYFIAEIQPHAASLNKRYHQLLPPFTTLEKILDSALPADYRTWKTLRNNLLDELTQAPRRHVEQLKSILQPCLNID
jgi:hypothetical protein